MNQIFGEILHIHIARDRWLLIGLLDAQDKIVHGRSTSSRFLCRNFVPKKENDTFLARLNDWL